jgi:hypothetical protein
MEPMRYWDNTESPDEDELAELEALVGLRQIDPAPQPNASTKRSRYSSAR